MPGLANRENVDGIEIHRVIRTLDAGPLFGASFVASLCWNLLRMARRCDVVFAGQAPWEAVATGLVCPSLRKPSVVCIQNTGPFGDLRQLDHAKGSRLLKRLVRRNRRFVVLSKHGREECLRMGIADEAVDVLTSGVDTARFAAPEENDSERANVALFVGRLAPQKNAMSLLEAWKQVNAQGLYRLLIAGSGPLRPSLDKYVARERLLGVEFLGQCDDMPAVYRRGAVFVLPSLSEGCPNALVEAMACGLCPVVTRIGGNVDVVEDGLNGLVVAPDDPARLAMALSSALESAPMRKRLGKAARAFVIAHHDIDKLAERYLEIFASTLAVT